MKKVFVAGDITEAYLVRDLLEMQGLDALVRGEDLWHTRGEVPFVDAWPSVWILDESREDDARAVVADYESRRTRPAATEPGWKCRRCGQELEAQFTACWSCGTERSLVGDEH
jgi:hypothetical protein